MAPSGLLPNCSMHWHRQAERGQAYFRLIKMKISVAPAQPDGNPEQFGKMLLGEHGGLRSVGNDAAFAQENYPLDLWNDFGYVMRHEQDPQPGLRKLAHGVAKLELRADVQSIARFVKQQGPRIVHQGSRNQRSLGFARGHLCDRAIGEMGDAKPRQRSARDVSDPDDGAEKCGCC